MKLSKQLKQDHECGDFGDALEGYSEKAEALEIELETLRRNICVYAREEMPECFDDYSDTSDQDVIDFFQTHYEIVEG